jgi:hypothetical protein
VRDTSTTALLRDPLQRSSLLVLGRRHLVRARNAPPGTSAEVLQDAGSSHICLVALTAGHTLVEVEPAGAATALQVLQGQLRIRRSGRAVTSFPGELVVGPLVQMEITALADSVVLVTGARAGEPSLSA